MNQIGRERFTASAELRFSYSSLGLFASGLSLPGEVSVRSIRLCSFAFCSLELSYVHPASFATLRGGLRLPKDLCFILSQNGNWEPALLIREETHSR